MAEMVGIATHVDYVECSHALEAEVRELRLIAEHKPRYNRRSRFPERSVFVKLTAERYPRLSLVRKVVDDGAVYLGPFGSARTAEVAVAAAHEAFRLRQCTQRISKKSSSPTCVLYEMGRCGGPCAGLEDERSYAEHVVAARLAIEADPEVLLTALRARMSACARDQRFEDAAVHRDRMAVFVRAAARTQRLVALGGCAQLVAARRRTRAGVDDGWDVIVVRHGRLAAAGAVPPGVPPRPAIDALVLAAEPVTPGPGPLPAATAEEMQVILRWLDEPGTRLVDLDGTWASPARGAARLLGWLDTATGAQVVPFDDRRGLRPQSRPARATG
jgi:DNA polymerase-3 subunit epsilon